MTTISPKNIRARKTISAKAIGFLVFFAIAASLHVYQFATEWIFLGRALHRAFGGMKHATYGNSVQVDLTYNARLQIGQYQASGFHTSNNTPYSMGATMSYYNDGRTNTAFDLHDATFDRKYEFDFSARLKEAYSGVEAHGQPAPPINQANSPYRQSYTYDEFNDVITRSGRMWTQYDSENGTYTSDNKRQGWGYDSGGNALTTFDGTYAYDAAARPATFTSFQTWQMYPNWPSNHPDSPALENSDTFDGTGQVARHVSTTRTDQSFVDEWDNIHYLMSESTATTYYVHSTALGGKTIAEVGSNGVIGDTFVYSGGARIATQHHYWYSTPAVIETTNPVTGAAITTDANASYPARQEPDPLGRDLTSPPQPGLVSDPVSGVLKDRWMPIEYTGGPSQDYLDANADWDSEMRFQTFLYQTDYFKHKNEFINAVVNKDFTLAEQILDKNPNFWISINGQMTAGKAGGDALESALLKLPGVSQALGMNGDSSQRFAHAPQNPPPRPIDKQHMLDDCKFLAATVEEYARKSRSDTTFVKALAKRFVTPSNQDSPEMREFRAGGFKGRFNDDQGSYNQVRHFVGGFSNAYYGGLAARVGLFDMPNGYDIAVSEGVRRANAREDPEETGDRNLNGVSVPLGVQLAFGRINRGQLGNLIRSQVCGSD